MNQLIRFCRGYVRLRLSGRMPERFLNLCAANQIELWDLLYVDDSYQITMSISDFRRLGPLCHKAGCRYHILEKHGMPFFFYNNRKRKGFFVGFLFFCGLLYMMSCYIWNIHIDGNYANSTNTILTFLEQKGVYHGIRKKGVSCQDISAEVRAAFPNVTWVSTRIMGTQLLVDIKENVDGYKERPKDEKDEAPCDLVASSEGEVVKIITRSGIPKVTEGSACKKGDLLVTGEIPILNDAGETIQYEYVHADSDIFLKTKYYYYKEFKRKYTHRTYSDKLSKYPFLEIGNIRLDTTKLIKDEGTSVNYENRHQLFLTENFALPVYYGNTTRREYTKSEKLYPNETCKKIANKQLQQYLDGLKKMGVQILGNDVKIDITDTACIAKGEVTVVLQAKKEIPCTIQEASPGKDNSLDEQ